MKDRICPICKKIIDPTESPNRRYHTGDCVRVANAMKIQKFRSAKKRAPEKSTATWIDKSCPYCGIVYKTTVKRDAVTCSDCKCKAAYQRDRVKRLENGTPEEQALFKKYRQKVSTQNRKYLKEAYEPPHEWRMCICPGCGERHLHRFEPAWIGRKGSTPRVRCTRYPACVNGDILELTNGVNPYKYRATWDSVWQADNGARV